jgi:hypothetical protein
MQFPRLDLGAMQFLLSSFRNATQRLVKELSCLLEEKRPQRRTENT